MKTESTEIELEDVRKRFAAYIEKVDLSLDEFKVPNRDGFGRIPAYTRIASLGQNRDKLRDENDQFKAALDSFGVATGNEHRTYSIVERIQDLGKAKEYFARQTEQLRIDCEQLRAERDMLRAELIEFQKPEEKLLPSIQRILNQHDPFPNHAEKCAIRTGGNCDCF